MTLKELRKKKKLTQATCAKYLGIPLRTYQNYETDASKVGSIKYNFMLQKLERYGFVDETHGILTIEQIKNICASVFEQYTHIHPLPMTSCWECCCSDKSGEASKLIASSEPVFCAKTRAVAPAEKSAGATAPFYRFF